MRNIRTTGAAMRSTAKGLAISAIGGSAGVALAAAVTSPGPATAARVPTPAAAATATATATASPTGTGSPAATAAPTPAVGVSLGGDTASPPPASTATRTRRPWFKTFVVPPCHPGVFFTIRYQKPVDIFIPRTEYVDGPGGEMEAWIKRFYLVRLHVSLDREVEGDFNIQNFTSKVRKMTNSAIEQDHAVEVGHEYVAKIHDHHYGHLRYRVFGLKVGFSMWRVFHNCGRLRVNTGLATFPTVREGWKYWETKSLQPTTSGRVKKLPKRGSPEP